MWVCHLVGIFEYVCVINTRVTCTCVQTRGHPPFQGFKKVIYLSFSSLMLKVQAGFRTQPDWQKRLLSQLMCVGVEEGFILCVIAHIVESTWVLWGLIWTFCTSPCLPFTLRLRVTEPEQNTEGHIPGTLPVPQQILSKHSLPSFSVTPTFRRVVFHMTVSVCIWCVRLCHVRSIATVQGLTFVNAELKKT